MQFHIYKLCSLIKACLIFLSYLLLPPTKSCLFHQAHHLLSWGFLCMYLFDLQQLIGTAYASMDRKLFTTRAMHNSYVNDYHSLSAIIDCLQILMEGGIRTPSSIHDRMLIGPVLSMSSAGSQLFCDSWLNNHVISDDSILQPELFHTLNFLHSFSPFL